MLDYPVYVIPEEMVEDTCLSITGETVAGIEHSMADASLAGLINPRRAMLHQSVYHVPGLG